MAKGIVRALYPGSFDPFTNGHLSVLEKAINVFDEIVIVISQNPMKKRRFGPKICKKCIEQAIKNKSYKDRVAIIISNDTLPARIAHEQHCSYIIRGIRNNMDYNYEEALAQFNDEYAKFKDDEIETIYFRAKFSEISSTMIYTFMQSGVPVDQYLLYRSEELLKDDNWSNR